PAALHISTPHPDSAKRDPQKHCRTKRFFPSVPWKGDTRFCIPEHPAKGPWTAALSRSAEWVSSSALRTLSDKESASHESRLRFHALPHAETDGLPPKMADSRYRLPFRPLR